MPYLGRQPNTGIRNRFIYTATASQTTFSGADTNGATLKYQDAAYVDVYQNGVLLAPADYTATSKTSVVLDTGATVSDTIEIIVYDIGSIQDTVSKANGGTFESNLTINGNLSISGTVDGRDVATDGTKLDGIEANATADQTASEILTAIKTVDGTGSGLDADTVDGIEASSFLQGNETITLSGDVSGSGTTSIVVTVADDSHNHVISNVDGLQTALDTKSPLASPTFTGTPAAPTATSGTNTTQIATTAFVQTAVSGLVDSAPATLDTLNELAAALGDDANFSTTVTNSIATKLPLAGGTMTGNIVMSGAQTVDGRDLSVDGAKLDGIESGATADQTASEILTAIKTVDGAGSGLDADTLDGIQAASFLQANQTITLSGDVSGSGTTSIAVTVADDSHNHIISNVDGLQTALDGKSSTSHNHTLDSLSNTTITSNTSGEILKWNGTAWINNTLSEAGIQPSGSYLTGNQTITLSGDVSGSGTTAITVTVADDSHNHIISNVDGLQTALDAKLASSSYTASDVLTKIKTVDGAGSGLDADLLDGISSASFLRSDAADTKTSGDLSFSDNVKATFGNSADLQIWHNGSLSLIQDTGTGNLVIQGIDLTLGSYTGETYATFTDNGAATLWYDNSQKLATTSTGVTVSGDLLVSGTGYTQISSGTTAQRPGSPSSGMIRFNSTTGYPEFYSTAFGGGWTRFSDNVGLEITVYAWGGGGGGGYGTGTAYGGGGGAAVGTFSAPSNPYAVVIGGGGDSRGPSAGPGAAVEGGGGLTGSQGFGGQGGGYTGIFLNFASQANAYLIAGGGGGGAYEGADGGAGGGSSGAAGGSGNAAGGGGGSQTAGGTSVSTTGSALQGGTSNDGDGGGSGGGGGGYWGGGAGSNTNPGSAGGGGSGYYNSSKVTATLYAGSGTTPGNSSESLRSGAGTGGSGTGAGSAGRLVIRYNGTTTRASGGTITNDGTYTYHTFTSSGTFTVT